MDFTTDLTTDSPTYQRPGGESLNYYYLLREVTVPSSGDYSVHSSSSFRTLGYLYANAFDPMNPMINLVGQGQSDASGQLQFDTVLQGPSQRLRRVRISIISGFLSYF